MKFRSFLISGLAAGLFMITGPIVVTFLATPYIPDGAESLGMGVLLLCFYGIWIISSPAFGVWLYRRFGNAVSIKDGLFIGVISGVFAIFLGLSLGIVYGSISFGFSETVERLEGLAEFTSYLPGIVLFASLGGFLGAIRFQTKTSSIAAGPEKSKLETGSAQDNVAHPVTASQPAAIAPSNKSPIVAALLSFFLFGGAGQIYLGQWKKGLALILLFFIFPILANVIGASDAYGTSQKLKKGNSVGEWEFTTDWKASCLAVMAVVLLLLAVIIANVFLIGYMAN